MKSKRSEDIVFCKRCSKPCRGSKTSRPTARPFQKALKGFCSSCVVTAMLQDMNPEKGLGFALVNSPNFTPETLRLPHIQHAFRMILEVGKSELPFDEIDWDEVIANWDLPFPGKMETYKAYKAARIM